MAVCCEVATEVSTRLFCTFTLHFSQLHVEWLLLDLMAFNDGLLRRHAAQLAVTFDARGNRKVSPCLGFSNHNSPTALLYITICQQRCCVMRLQTTPAGVQ